MSKLNIYLNKRISSTESYIKTRSGPNLAKKKDYNLTRNQLKKWGVNYAKLIFGKPSFDYIIDDKSIFFKKDWHKFI